MIENSEGGTRQGSVFPLSHHQGGSGRRIISSRPAWDIQNLVSKREREREGRKDGREAGREGEEQGKKMCNVQFL